MYAEFNPYFRKYLREWNVDDIVIITVQANISWQKRISEDMCQPMKIHNNKE